MSSTRGGEWYLRLLRSRPTLVLVGHEPDKGLAAPRVAGQRRHRSHMPSVALMALFPWRPAAPSFKTKGPLFRVRMQREMHLLGYGNIRRS